LATTLDSSKELHFSLASTALQALASAEVREDPIPFEEVYYTGARPGDRVDLDDHVAAVASAMEAHLTDVGNTGVTTRAQALPETVVFNAIETMFAGVPAPVVVAPATAGHLGKITAPAGSTLAFFSESTGYSPHFTLPPGDQEASFFLYSVALDQPRYLRARQPSGDNSLASSTFLVPSTPPGPGPDAPTLELLTTVARACGGVVGNFLVFFSSSTELAVGFAAVPVGADGCGSLSLAEIPTEVGLLNAIQVAPDLRFSDPSGIVFP
jgi:hypothetical protein